MTTLTFLANIFFAFLNVAYYVDIMVMRTGWEMKSVVQKILHVLKDLTKGLIFFMKYHIYFWMKYDLVMFLTYFMKFAPQIH